MKRIAYSQVPQVDGVERIEKRSRGTDKKCRLKCRYIFAFSFIVVLVIVLVLALYQPKSDVPQYQSQNDQLKGIKKTLEEKENELKELKTKNDQLERIQKTLEKEVKELKGAEGALRTKVIAEGAPFDLKYNKLKTDGRLTNIFENTGTDKLDTHHYNLWYENYFAPYRYNKIHFLEIGADTGKSIAAWPQYFENANLIQGVRYGVKTDSEKLGCEAIGLKAPCSLVQIVDGNQNDPKFLNKLAETKWDIIVDDGSHVPEHQIRSFIHLFPSIAPGGLYVVEDTETSYWKSPASIYEQKFENSGIGKDYPGNIMNLFFDLIHIVNRKYYSSDNGYHIISKEIDHEIANIVFAPNVIFIFKKDIGFGTIGRPLSRPLSSTDADMEKFVENAREKLKDFLQ